MNAHDDEGLSLIELIITVVLIGVIAGAALMILVNSWRAQGDVTTNSEATNSGQFYGQSIERAMRNAVAFEVSASGRMLQVQTSLGGERACQAFWIAPPKSGTGDPGFPDALYMTVRSGALPTASAALWPDPWQDEGVTADGGDYFRQSGSGIVYAFDIKTDVAPVAIRGAASPRIPAPGGTNPCW